MSEYFDNMAGPIWCTFFLSNKQNYPELFPIFIFFPLDISPLGLKSILNQVLQPIGWPTEIMTIPPQ